MNEYLFKHKNNVKRSLLLFKKYVISVTNLILYAYLFFFQKCIVKINVKILNEFEILVIELLKMYKLYKNTY